MTSQIVLLALIFLAVAGLVLGLGLWLYRDELVERRLDQLGREPEEAGTGEKGEEAVSEWHAKVVRMAAPIAWLSTPKAGWETSNLRVRFMQAGLRGPGWPVIYFGAKTLLALVLPGLLLLYATLINSDLMAKMTWPALLLLATIGYYLPNLLLLAAARQRQRELRDAFPDAIDLMRVCVEAGLGLDAAMNRTGSEIAVRSQALADELNLVALELRVGSTRESALQNFALRSGVDDIATFVTIILQSEHFGTNVAESLRVLSDTMRERRKIRAEETAAKIPLKLLFPLIFLIFPSLFLVLLGPAMIGIFRTILPTMLGAR